MEEEKKVEQKEEKQTKKWRGKDWFVILAPDMFGKVNLSETPTTDPKNLMGRNIEISFSELSGNPSKYYMKLIFKIEKLEGKNLLTRFNGLSVTREYLFRMVRKRTQKIRLICYIETNDKWKLQATMIAVLNRNTDAGVQKSVRAKMESILKDTASKLTIGEFVNSITSGSTQQSMRKTGTKIYPVRFVEIEKIEVIATGDAK